MAIEVLNKDRAWGKVSELAQTYAVSRKTIYDIAAKGQQVLLAGLQPGPHGPSLNDKLIRVDRNRLVRGSVVLSEVGVSQRDVTVCLSELLDTQLSPSWVNASLAQVEQVAAGVNQAWQPQIEESLSGDEIYANGQPNLVLVGNDWLYVYALSRQPSCDGDTWGCLLLAGPDCQQFASAGGTGLAAGAKAAEIEVHQLDWDHLLRPLWGQAARLEKQAYAALHQVEQRAALFEQAQTEKRLQQHLAKWEQLNQQATAKIAQFDAFYQIARQVDDWFALIELSTGQVPDVTVGISQLQALAEQLQIWSGRIYQKLASNLNNWAPQLFSYQPLLRQSLVPLQTRYGDQAIAALSRMWQIETDQKRRPLSLLQQQQRHTLWPDSLDEAWTLLGQHLWTAWHELGLVLGRSWRGSMLAECVNSLLRPLLDRRKQTDQGCLELFRLLHNVRPFKRGKRADHSPAQLVGLDVPADPLLLLGLEPKVLI
jgi:predicted DNA-binding protein YlxM (UPF0122 family)